MDEERTIKITTNDGKSIEMSTKAASKSSILKGMIEDYPDNEEFPLNKVNSTLLEKVKEYLIHYQDTEPPKIEVPLKSNVFKDCVTEWDNNYLGENIDLVFDLMNAANYLDIKSLYELASAKLGSKIKGMNSDNIKKDFDIPPLMEEEKAQIMKDKQYLEDNL